jgi:hypothetical protein
MTTFFFKILYVLKWGLLFDEWRSQTTTGNSPSTEAVRPCDGSGKFLLALASTVILGSDFRGTHDHSSLPHDSGSHATLSTQPYDEQFVKQYMSTAVSLLGNCKMYVYISVCGTTAVNNREKKCDFYLHVFRM